MDPTAGSNPRRAIPHVHRLDDSPKSPDPRVQVIADEELADHSPDGRRAGKQAWSRGRMTLMAILSLGLPAVVFGVWYWGGGKESLLMGLVYVGLFILVSYPVWYSGLIRQREHNEATEIVRQTLSSEQFATGGAARDRAPGA
jgi:hypothetical protein